VSDVAGTTRDVLEVPVLLPGGKVLVLDVAGVEDEGGESADETRHGAMADIRRQMQRQTLAAKEQADVRVGVIEAHDTREAVFAAAEVSLVVRTKSDLLRTSEICQADEVLVSATCGDGIEALKQRLSEIAFTASTAEHIALSARHMTLLESAAKSLELALTQMSAGHEVCALALGEALGSLAAISGEVTPDDILGKVFATFCVGK
jgi:tRNA modification GTPase